MNAAYQETVSEEARTEEAGHVLHLESGHNSGGPDSGRDHDWVGRVGKFFLELRRRRVCRCAAMYAVGYWLICQIVDVIVGPMGLPDWTLKLVIVLGLILFPVILVLSWLVDITPSGLVVDDQTAPRVPARPHSKGLFHQLVDYGLIISATLIGLHLAGNLADSEDASTKHYVHKIAVEPILLDPVADLDSSLAGLSMDLQHALTGRYGVVVIASADTYTSKDLLRLRATVTGGKDIARIAITLIDNASGEVTWSRIIEQRRNSRAANGADLVELIIGDLPWPFGYAVREGSGYET